MAIGQFNPSNGNQGPNAEINMTPLVDVMLVLLIIFIITAPLMTHSVNVELPRAASNPLSHDRPAALQVSVTLEGAVMIGDERVDLATMEQRFREAIARDPKTEMHLKADRDARYGAVAETMSAAHRAGLTRIGFITQPSPDSPGR
ncbi:MAG: biopolymer transporter ExbD [Candidatus Accumulibacter sp.]|jgi:biopolymer transport protein ExbD|nr:biopolymer transporter ExbD [Accumulibacter sp.]